MRRVLIMLFIALSLTTTGCQSNDRKTDGGNEFNAFRVKELPRIRPKK